MFQGSVGYGIGPLSTPLLAIVNPDFVPGPILLAVLFLSTLIAVRDYQAVDRQGLKWASRPGSWARSLEGCFYA
jgi:hypothetical protein